MTVVMKKHVGKELTREVRKLIYPHQRKPKKKIENNINSKVKGIINLVTEKVPLQLSNNRRKNYQPYE